MTSTLNTEQLAAVEDILTFLSEPKEPGEPRFFLLQGSAGTGKTFTVKELTRRLRGRLIFSAPTNKAVRILKDTLTTDSYKPECRTIYSLLGLRLEANGEMKVLTEPEDPVDLTRYVAVIVDEASMVNQTLMQFIRTTSQEQGVAFIFLGDPAQLPPVKETSSEVWKTKRQASLQTVMRHDNQILALATALRKVVNHPAPRLTIESSNANGEGVWRCAEAEFDSRIIAAAEQGRFSTPNCAKAIAWRNSTVDSLNRRIRSCIFDNPTEFWLPDDRIILTEPARDIDGEVIATTDEEGRVERVEEEWHPEYGEFKIYRLRVTSDEGTPIILRVIHPDWQLYFAREVTRLAEEARGTPRKWKNFWAFKEAFHQVRHGYAITAHRSQGSTYEAAFVEWRDILINRNRQEAYRCLYVACTRPKKELYLG